MFEHDDKCQCVYACVYACVCACVSVCACAAVGTKASVEQTVAASFLDRTLPPALTEALHRHNNTKQNVNILCIINAGKIFEKEFDNVTFINNQTQMHHHL